MYSIDFLLGGAGVPQDNSDGSKSDAGVTSISRGLVAFVLLVIAMIAY
jgi:hypothetical protein